MTFPQANDINKLIKLIKIPNPERLKDMEYLLDYLDVKAERTVGYYISTLDFFNITKKRKFLPLGTILRTMDEPEFSRNLKTVILGDPVFNTVYQHDATSGLSKMSQREIMDVIEEYYPGINETTKKRRASVVDQYNIWCYMVQ